MIVSQGGEKDASPRGEKLMFSVVGGGSTFSGLTAREAALKARSLRRSGSNDVELFRSDGSRISQYALDQIVRLEAEHTSPS